MKQKITQKKQNRIHIALHTVELIAILIMAVFIYTAHYLLNDQGKSSAVADRLLQSQITNLRQCMHANDHSIECTSVIHDVDN